ncbi:hypothetical protein [Parendozoicomonas sp. Alg238-R29]|uniref:hypothetical protein n=1 Tax=Parendozoicomonas sp. Alg238-R29 TaxID=2993446 RepID=UPI00248F0C66|nr:hypothetical protein [Parendozoicomonas sp. Alg238-R29]
MKILEKALQKTGFVKCDFSGDSEPCEKCKEVPHQLYWRRTDPFENDGEYYCLSCVAKEAKENARAVSESERTHLINDSFSDSQGCY